MVRAMVKQAQWVGWSIWTPFLCFRDRGICDASLQLGDAISLSLIALLFPNFSYPFLLLLLCDCLAYSSQRGRHDVVIANALRIRLI